MRKKNDFHLYDQRKCIDAAPKKFNILLIGGSNAEQWFSVLHQNLQKNQTLSLATSSGCKPLLPLQGIKRCNDLINRVINDLTINTQVDSKREMFNTYLKRLRY
jgi:hypothetical protein